MTIAVTGSMAFDYIMSFPGNFDEHILPDQIGNLSVSFLVDEMRRERGGTAGNIAYSLALLGQRGLLMATVGRDGREYVEALAQLGVDTSGVLYLDDLFTASFFVSTDRGNRQIANFYAGAMAQSARISFHDYDPQAIQLAIISPSSPDGMVKYVRECKELAIRYVYDPSQQLPRLGATELREGIDGAYMLTVNDYEFEMIKSKTRLSLDDVKAMTSVLVITRGEAGSTIYQGEEIVHVPAAAASPIDPTGGGDAYRGGLLAAWAGGLAWPQAGRVAALAATYAIEKVGTQQHRYAISEFAERYFANFERETTVERFFDGLSG